MQDQMPDLYVVKKDGVAIDVRTSTTGVVGLNEFVDAKLGDAGAGTVSSVNGKVGEVVLNAADVKALPILLLSQQYQVMLLLKKTV